MSRTSLIIGSILYVLLLAYGYLYGLPHGLAFAGDAADYNAGALHLLHEHFYSIDGVHPFLQREPLYSLFLALVYVLSAAENVLAIFVCQALLYFVSSVVFVRELVRSTSRRIASITFVLLLSSPSVVHALLIVYREAFALSIFLLLATSILSLIRTKHCFDATLTGLLLGLLPLAYYPFVFLPIGLAGYLLFEKIPARKILLILLLFAAISGSWAYRNERAVGTFAIVGSARTDILWYVRGEQSEKVRGIEPLLCLYAEYVSRDWSHRSNACSYNSLANTRWPQGVATGDPVAAAMGRAKIRAHFGSYLWFSIVDAIELHLPFVGGGWSFVFNLLAAIGSFVVYLGCVLSIRRMFSRRYVLFLLVIGYNTIAFILTDATPRYLIPVTFCYGVLAAVGYDGLLKRSKSSES